MRRLLLLLIAFSFLPTSAYAGCGGYYPTSQLPYWVMTVTCKEVMAKMNHNNATKMQAASLLLAGQTYADRCNMKKDYVRAFQIMTELGHACAIKPKLRAYEARAAAGSAYYASLLRKLKKAGFSLK